MKHSILSRKRGLSSGAHPSIDFTDSWRYMSHFWQLPAQRQNQATIQLFEKLMFIDENMGFLCALCSTAMLHDFKEI